MIKIKAMKLMNCQSWSDSVLEFSSGLNVIRARNNTGKSVVFKMLKITCNPKYYSREEREKLIRYKAQYAEVAFIFDDNSACMTRVFPNSVIYYYSPDIDNVQLNQKVGEPHKEILDRLGVVIEQESGFMANIIDLEQDLLLVNSESKANLNLVKILTEHQDLNRLTEDLFNKLGGLKIGLDKVTNKREQCKYRLEGYKYQDTSAMKSKLDLLEALSPVIRSLKSINSCMNTCSRTVDNYDTLNFCKWLLEFSLDLSILDDIKVIKSDYSRDDVDLLNTSIEILPVLDILSGIKCSCANKDRFDDLLLLIDLFDNINQSADNLTLKNNLNETKDLISLANVLGDFNLSYFSDNIVTVNNMKLEIEDMKNSLNSLGSKLDCPVHGTITFVDGECIPVFKD